MLTDKNKMSAFVQQVQRYDTHICHQNNMNEIDTVI